jgi:hypothetical protein
MDCGEIKQTTRSKTSKTHRVRWAKVADSPQTIWGLTRVTCMCGYVPENPILIESFFVIFVGEFMN